MNRDSDCSTTSSVRKPSSVGNRVVGLQDLPFEVGDEHRVRSVLDEALGIGPGFVEFPHVAENADRADHSPVHIPESRGIQGGGNDLARGRPRMQHRVSSHAAFHDLAQRRGELAGFLGADEPGQRLLEHLILPEAEELRNRVVGLQNLPFQVGDEHRVRGVFDEALGIGPGFVQLPHVAENPDRPDHLAVGIPKRRGIERRGNDLPRGAAGVQAGVANAAPLDHLAKGRRELAGLFGADEPRQRLLQHLVLPKPQQFGNRVVGLKNLPLQVRNEHRVRGVRDDDVRIERVVGGGFLLDRCGRLIVHELLPSKKFGRGEVGKDLRSAK
jgi:hypothetical protein